MCQPHLVKGAKVRAPRTGMHCKVVYMYLPMAVADGFVTAVKDNTGQQRHLHTLVQPVADNKAGLICGS